jgi:uncharacterized Zn-binding protein involved in type VI secretion
MRLASSIAFLVFAAGAQAADNAPAKIITGNGGVIVEGDQAATAGDQTDQGTVVTEGSSNVFIGGKPAAIVGSGTNCGGQVVTGSSSVFINGKPMALSGSLTAPCPNN